MQLHLGPIIATAFNLLLVRHVQAFSLAPQNNKLTSITTLTQSIRHPQSSTTTLKLSENTNLNENNDDKEKLAQTFGGYTAKQRLREEVESPFRKVRLILFASATGSAFTAFYFSFLSALKATMGGYADAPPIEEALTNVGINIAAIVVCGYFTFNDWKKGQANLERIKRGGDLAKLAVDLAEGNEARERGLQTMSDFRRGYRVLICAGGKELIEDVCRSLCADQLKDENILTERLCEVDTLIVPVLLVPDPSGDGGTIVGDTKGCWMGTVAGEGDRNFDVTKADSVVGFPQGNAAWAEYLNGDVETASGQGFDVLNKGITVSVKKNGRILSRVTGMPKWGELIGTMNVLDGSKFGMPGDSEKYGGP